MNFMKMSVNKTLRIEVVDTLRGGAVMAILLILVIVFINCSEKRVTRIENIPVDTIHFMSLKKISSLADTIIKNKKYINLSTSDDELLFSSIHQIVMKSDSIYILDNYAKVLAVFDTLGNGIGKVGTKGRAPGEYLNATAFSVDKAGNIFLLDGRQDIINIYGKNLKLIRNQKPPFEIDAIHCLSNSHFLVGLSSWNQENDDKVVLTDSNFNILESYCQYDEFVDQNFGFGFYGFVENAQGIFYNRYLDNMVYIFSKEGKPVRGVYFDFGNKEVPLEIKKDFEKYMDIYKDKYFLNNFTVITDNYILGHVNEVLQVKTFLINRLKNTVYMEDCFSISRFGYICGCYDDKIISFIAPGEYMKMKEEGKESELPLEVKNHLENGGFSLCIYEVN